MKKETLYIIIGIVVILVVVTQFKVAKMIPPGESDKGITLTACVSDVNKNCVSPQQAVVTLHSGTTYYGYGYLTLFSKITPSGNVPYIIVDNIVGLPLIYQQAIDEQYNKTLIINQGEINSQSALVNLSDVDYGMTEFKLEAQSHYNDALGSRVDITPNPFGTINILLESETCDDGTPWGQCNPNIKPKYCQPGQLYQNEQLPYIPGTLINKASVCGCPINQHTSGDECIWDECQSGIAIFQCSTALDTNQRYCDGNLTLREACQQCGCSNDYYNNPYTSCSSPGALDGTDLCQYQTYAGTITIGLSGEDCIESWSCTAWSTCTAGTQTRTCTDTNSCGTTTSKPAETQSCTMHFVLFRTESLDYDVEPEIAFTTGNCGSSLSSFDLSTSSTILAISCETMVGKTTIMTGLPGETGGHTDCILQFDGSLNRYEVCCDSNGNNGQMKWTSGTGESVSLSTSSIDTSLEKTCTI